MDRGPDPLEETQDSLEETTQRGDALAAVLTFFMSVNLQFVSAIIAESLNPKNHNFNLEP